MYGRKICICIHLFQGQYKYDFLSGMKSMTHLKLKMKYDRNMNKYKTSCFSYVMKFNVVNKLNWQYTVEPVSPRKLQSGTTLLKLLTSYLQVDYSPDAFKFTTI